MVRILSNYSQLSVPPAQLQSLIQRGQLAGFNISQIVQIIFSFGVPIMEQILSMMGSNPTVAAIEAVLAVLSGLFNPTPSPTPAPTPTPTPPPIPDI